jgi:hypothetical protein
MQVALKWVGPAAVLAMATGCQLLFPLNGFDVDGGVDPVSCASANAVLCEDFEGGLKTERWRAVLQNSGTAVLTNRAEGGSQINRGNGALHVSTQAAPEVQALLQHNETLPALLFLRLFVFMRTANVTAALTTALEDRGSYLGINLRLAAGRLVVTDWGNPGQQNYESPAAFPLGRWVCLEWKLDGIQKETQVWQDGTEVPELHATALVMPTYEVLKVGLETKPGDATYEAWFDDLYVDTAPIGCTK